MEDLIRWYVETLIKVMRLMDVEDGPCYRVADGTYVRAVSFELLFDNALEQTAWMLLRNGDMTGELERWAILVNKHREDACWLENKLESEFMESELALCYYTEL